MQQIPTLMKSFCSVESWFHWYLMTCSSSWRPNFRTTCVLSLWASVTPASIRTGSRDASRNSSQNWIAFRLSSGSTYGFSVTSTAFLRLSYTFASLIFIFKTHSVIRLIRSQLNGKTCVTTSFCLQLQMLSFGFKASWESLGHGLIWKPNETDKD